MGIFKAHVVAIGSSDNTIHLLDGAEPDIRSAQQMTFDLHSKSNVRLDSVQQMFCYAESIE